MEIIIILIVILVVFYFCYLSSKNNKLTKTEAFDAQGEIKARVNDPPPRDYITMYEHHEFHGTKFDCPIGYTSYETLNNQGWNDKASSIHVPPGLRAVFYEDGGRGGQQLSLSAGSYPSLVNMGWNDRISCVDVFRV
jgi:hypothetical protein